MSFRLGSSVVYSLEERIESISKLEVTVHKFLKNIVCAWFIRDTKIREL